MSNSGDSKMSELLTTHETSLLTAWIEEQGRIGVSRGDLMSASELREQSTEFVRLLGQAASSRKFDDAL